MINPIKKNYSTLKNEGKVCNFIQNAENPRSKKCILMEEKYIQ